MTRTSRNKTVVLDLGNVVLDWDVDRILAALDLQTEETNLLRNELFSHQDWVDMDHGKQSEASVVSSVCARTPLTADVVEQALLTAKNSLAPIEESLLLMQEISNQGITMYCLSNMSRETYDHISEREFFEMFDGIVISGIEKCMKPGIEIFQLLINRFELVAAELFFIDDSLPNVETARGLGIDGFHFKRSQECYSEIRQVLL